MTFCTLVSVFVFDTPMRGSFVSLALLTAAFLAACLGLGLLVSTLAKSQFIAGQIAEYGHVVNSHRAYLGVQTVPTTADGVLVVGVVAGGPADRAGIRAGDLITSVSGTPTPAPGELSKVLATKAPGNVVPVSIVRADGSRATASVTLGELPGV